MPQEKNPSKKSPRRQYEERLIANIRKGMKGMGITERQIRQQGGAAEKMAGNENGIRNPNRKKLKE